MRKRKYLIVLSLVALALSCVPQTVAPPPDSSSATVDNAPAPAATPDEGRTPTLNLRATTAGDRKAAAARAAQAREEAGGSLALAVPGGQPDYFGPAPNWAFSPAPTVDPVTGAVTGGIRKFHDGLAGLGTAGANNLQNFVPVAHPDTITYPDCDYYEIWLQDYFQQMHFDLPLTKLRGYVQVNNGTDTDPQSPTFGQNVIPPDPQKYLGPVIIAAKDRPVRVKFTNMLDNGTAGDLFIPVDTTVMGAGMGPTDMPGMPGMKENYTQNRATLHLHGGNTPWISDGTAHQWTTPANEMTSYPRGVSTQMVPDMWFDATTHALIPGASLTPPTQNATNDPGAGSITFYYTNQQSARLMFYHDHAYGITRLNVYAGEASGYLVTDPAEETLINNGVLPNAGGLYRYGIPLIIQDKTFVDAATILTTDPTWNWGTTAPIPHTGDLWMPHVYMPNQNPLDPGGANGVGRWDYGPWFWPPLTAAAGLRHGPIMLPDGTQIPGTPNPSMAMESFVDTPIVNGVAYPTVTLARQAYRFRILNACNDRFLNLQLYYAEPVSVAVLAGGSGYDSVWPPNTAVTFSGGGASVQAQGIATVANGVVTAITVTNPGVGYTFAPTVTITDARTGGTGTGALAMASINTEVKMVPAYPHAFTPVDWDDGTPENDPPPCAAGVTVGVPTVGDPRGCYPSTWPTDGRMGGVPDPLTAGPSMIQIGTEGGFLPAPAVLDNTPVGYDYNRRSIVVLNVTNHTLFLGPAERADVVVDLSGCPAGSTLILYNDSPAPVPAFDPRNDYYTGDPDQSMTGDGTGGAPTTLPGYGPNTRTIMQIKIDPNTPASLPFDLVGLQNAFATTGTTPGVFAASLDPIIVPQEGYNSAYNGTFPADTRAYARIQSTVMQFTPLGASAPLPPMPLEPKAIQELFELDYGRMNAILGMELPFTNMRIQTTIPYGYIDPPTEIIKDSPSVGVPGLGDGTQIWKITHNGVDTHAIHFHLFNVQLLNRVGWDGAVTPPQANELGWKDTIRMNPLEDCFVALRPVSQNVPFKLPDSIRPLDPTQPIGGGADFTNIDPNTGNPIVVTNQIYNFGWEYVWHCHLLGHEEMDMMRPIVFQVSPAAASNLTAAPAPTSNVPPSVTLSWTNNATNPAVTNFLVQRATNAQFTQGVVTLPPVLAPATTFVDTPLTSHFTYFYRVRAENAKGYSDWSNVATAITNGWIPADPTNLQVPGRTRTSLTLTWTDNATNENGYYVYRSNSSNPNSFGNNPIATLAANSTTFTNTGLQRNRTYYYRVRAFNADGNSGYTLIVPGTTLP